MITIGQLAEYAGVTVRAVRHYHRLGLLAEPERDASGYRRYSAADAIRLIKIRTLAEAGVPLARVRELLEAGPRQFADAVAEIDGTLQVRQTEIADTRERIARLRATDELFVTEDVAAFLQGLRELGVSPRGVEMERDAWILMWAVSPEAAALWLADKVEALSDPEFRAVYLLHDAAYDWAADDPRLPAVAERSRRWLSGRAGRGAPGGADGAAVRPVHDVTGAPLVVASLGMSSPAWRQLRQLAAEPPS